MNYNNIPQQRLESNSDLTVKVFDQYYQAPIDINNNELTAMIGFFESRGFGKDAAESTAIVILKQAKKDKYNPMQILNTLSGLDNVEISGLVAEILNYNRFKTSSLGVSELYAPADAVVRNILP